MKNMNHRLYLISFYNFYSNTLLKKVVKKIVYANNLPINLSNIVKYQTTAHLSTFTSVLRYLAV